MRPTEHFQRFNDRQRHALDGSRNLAVRAGAGSGKTNVLVERTVQLLARSWDEGQPLRLLSLVAITFTRKAAAELQERLRQSFRRLAQCTPGPVEQAYWHGLIEELPRAMIGTIDSFCARILREFAFLDPSSDRMEPDFEPLEAYDETLFKREAVDRLINRLSDARSERDTSEQGQAEACQWWATTHGYETLARHLMLLLDHAVEPATITATHRDLPPAVERVQEAWSALPAVRFLQVNRDAVCAELEKVVEQIADVAKPTTTQVKLQNQLRDILGALQTGSQGDDNNALEMLRETLFTKAGEPRKGVGLNVVGPSFQALQETWVPLLQRFAFDYAGEVAALEAADGLVHLLEPAYEEYLQLCREANRFDFLSIARKTRDLLRSCPGARGELKRRYRYLMVDEFQDTNYLQWEILSWLAGDGPDTPLDPDRLFIVGDPQQSIYRFRHANVSVFHHVQESIRSANQESGHGSLPTDYDRYRQEMTKADHSSTPEQRLGLMPLKENYRSLRIMPLGLLNRVFGYVFDPVAHRLDLEHNRFEVEHQDLVPGVQSEAVGDVRYVYAMEPEADELGDSESLDESPPAEDLGRVQVRAVVDQLTSLHGQPKHTAKDGDPRTLRWNDMAVLLPSRDVVLTELEKELRRRRVPFVVSKGIGFWQRQEVQDGVNLATCLADPGDELALFAVLRSPIGQLTDTEILFLSQLGRGSLERGLRAVLSFQDIPPASRPPAEGDGDWLAKHWEKLPEPIRAVLPDIWQRLSLASKGRIRATARQLGDWVKRVDRMAHADLLQRCLEESGAYAIYAAEPDADVMLANLGRLFDTIRAEDADASGVLARVARRLRARMEDSFREEQAVADATCDAVQIMTVHAAKGLEFPVVAIMKMERQADLSGRSWHDLMVVAEGDALLREDAAELPPIRTGTVAVSIRHPRRPRQRYTPRLLRALQRLDRAQQLAESRRLFYVAATRAKERVILAGRQTKRKVSPSWQEWLEAALGITDEHKEAGLWEDAASGLRIPIVTQAEETTLLQEAAPALPQEALDLGYIHERPKTPTLSATGNRGLEVMRASWQSNPAEWWLKYRVHVLPHVDAPPMALPAARSASNDSDLGAVIGTLVHRLFEMGQTLQQPWEKLKNLLEAMAGNMLAASPLTQDEPGDQQQSGTAMTAVAAVVAAVHNILERLRGDSASAVRALLEAPGEGEISFSLGLDRWQVQGRFDKLLATPAGFEIVDWKTDADADSQIIVERHTPQMRLYALALYRAGQAGLVNDCVAHLVLLHHLLVRTLRFSVAELEALEVQLIRELQAMEAYQPDETEAHLQEEVGTRL